MKKIGITGVMGAGKSSVIEMLKNAGYHVLDCDRINDELLMKGHEMCIRDSHKNVSLHEALEV